MAETNVRPVGSWSSTTTCVAASGPKLSTSMVKVIVSPTLGFGSSTTLITARSACSGVTVSESVLLLGFWSGVVEVAVAVLVRGNAGPEAGVATVATTVSVLVVVAGTVPSVQTPVPGT